MAAHPGDDRVASDRRRLISSDALALDDGESALITYWEIPHDTADLDVYRCVDVVGRQFSPLRQTCWKVLRPAGRPRVQDE